MSSQGSSGTYKSDVLHPMVGMHMPRYDLLKKHRYVNRNDVGLLAERFASHNQQAFLRHPVGGLDDSLCRRPAEDNSVLRKEFVGSRQHKSPPSAGAAGMFFVGNVVCKMNHELTVRCQANKCWTRGNWHRDYINNRR
jgi:hypothetical protein